MKNNLVFLIMVTLATWSCKKSAVNTDNTAVLESHEWYPYQTEIIITDTTKITLRGTGNSPSVTTQRFDTLVTLEPCMQQSYFSFRQNGALHISNACRTEGYDSAWTLTQNRLLATVSVNSAIVQNFYTEHFPDLFIFSAPDSSHSYVSSRGNITTIDNAHFIFNNAVINATFDIANITADTLRMINAKEFTTYKAR